MDTNNSCDFAEMIISQMVRMMGEGALTPGEQISLRMMAQIFGVSTQPASIAFKMLESEGLLITKKRSGTRIALLTPEDVWDSMQLRLAVEEKAVELACRYATDAELDSLMKLAENADMVTNSDESLKNDDLFHLQLCSLSKSPALYQYMRRNLPFFRVRSFLCPAIFAIGKALVPRVKAGTVTKIRGHQKITALIRQRKSDRAKKLLNTHICVKGIEQLLAEYRQRHTINLWEREL
ncbi:MAG: GntR family transcriptional regulator [Lentisphaeria bacterium]|nr:GntR family transcriptional regulator [Lentisphaeria bacterium]